MPYGISRSHMDSGGEGFRALCILEDNPSNPSSVFLQVAGEVLLLPS